ncbi:MAG: tetratricopeptide repeat protein [Pseudomonadota bacterium]
MKTGFIKRTLAHFAIFSLVAGCGGPSAPPPQTPKDETVGKPTIPAAAAKKAISGEAQKDFDTALKSYKESGGVTSKNCADLANEFAQVYTSHPNVAAAKFNEGVIWEECAETDKAKAAYEELVRTHHKFGAALNNLGEICFRRGEIPCALSYFEKAADSKSSAGYSNLALLQRNRAIKGEPMLVKDAVDNIHRALAMDSFNIEAYGTLAILLYDHAKKRSQLNMARLICVQATKKDPKYAPIRNTLGLINLKMEKVTPALISFREAVSLDPTLIDSHMNIGAITLGFRDYDAAEEAFSKVLALGPKDEETRFAATVGLGVAFRGQRKYEKAMAKYKEAKAMQPNNVDIDYNMGVLVQDYLFNPEPVEKGVAQLEKAKTFLVKYLSNGQDPEKKQDVELRIKNIDELIPMMLEQEKMAREMRAEMKAQAERDKMQPPQPPVVDKKEEPQPIQGGQNPNN